MTTELPPPAPVRKPGRGRWAALGTAAVLSAVVVGGGVGFGVLQVVNKPKHQVAAAKKPAAAKPPRYGALSNGDHFGSLGDLLLPVPMGMEPGPDFYEFGNDTVLSASEYQAIFTKSIGFMSTADRKLEEQDFLDSHTKGYALRTYLQSDSTVITLALRQENQQSATLAAKSRKHLADATGAYRPGPGVPGFPATHCYLPPLPSGDKLDYMDCDASVGDISVWMDVEGVAPLDSAAAVSLLSQQLTRLAIPGAQT
ncbi:hypothetical protein [Streptacidiphilus sp. PAMC 29251]